ncbi:MAG: hypothetical protein HEP71_00620 [Roseivirga sp.]|nr:hypothetical protein [Roseivirga sp.]
MNKRYYTIYEGQSLLDVALELYGDIEGVITLIEDNPELSSLDDDLYPGQQLLIDSSKTINEDVASYYKQEAIRLNSRSASEEAPVADLSGLISQDDILLRDLNDEILKANDQ